MYYIALIESVGTQGKTIEEALQNMLLLAKRPPTRLIRVLEDGTEEDVEIPLTWSINGDFIGKEVCNESY
jgi:pyrimidine operon attenuation protein/uracil phosphoribosyltransferase